jgi:hypothetical protein
MVPATTAQGVSDSTMSSAEIDSFLVSALDSPEVDVNVVISGVARHQADGRNMKANGNYVL